MGQKLRVLIHSNGSRAITGFGKNAKNILLALFNDPDIEPIEAANGYRYGGDLKTPWESYGTYPSDPSILASIKGDPHKERACSYGYYTIDEIIQKSKPDVYLGIEDIWAFVEFQNKPWWNKIPSIIWTTLDSLPILPMAEQMAPKADKFFVWASFAEEAMKAKGFSNVKTIHGAVDYEHFYKLENKEKKSLKSKHTLEKSFVVGFVFKNQLRKSAPNLLEGFKLFKDQNPESNAKLLLHTDWGECDSGHGWDLPAYIREKGVDPNDVLSTYVCRKCKEYKLIPYTKDNIQCPFCGGHESFATKNINHGCSEAQLNELYNIMDVYCHPFTSGGQELPIQEAKAAGLITLVTDYSCGTDAVGDGTGGLPLDWAEYREPGTNFIKSTTLPESIAKRLQQVYYLNKEDKDKLSKEAVDYVKREYSVKSVVEKLKRELLEYNKTDYNFQFGDRQYNLDYPFPEIEDNAEWVMDVYKNVCDKIIKPDEAEVRAGVEIIEKDGKETLFAFIKDQVRKKMEDKQEAITIEHFLGDEGKEGRIAVVIPESAGDVLMVNSFISNLKKEYPHKNIYVITKQEYFDMINDNPDVYKLIPFSDQLENLLYLEGKGSFQGFFEIAFLTHINNQRYLTYLHNGKDTTKLTT